MTVQNSKGKVWYGLHFYPGVAEYRDPEKTYRVFLNEKTLRVMDSTFAGRPVFVQHVDGVSEDLNVLRNEADGWVIKSFYNEADGKHWCEFITVTEKAERAIKNNMRLSNCYLPKSFAGSGMWNGVDYEREITDAEYEHLAIVANPRYEESIILTPEQFKKYNDDRRSEFLRVANEKKEGVKMRWNFFERKKVENSIDIENMLVVLPKSKREVAITQLLNEADEQEVSKDQPRLANQKDFVEIEGKKVSVSELVEKFVNASKECMPNEDDEEKDDEVMENEEDKDEDLEKKAAEEEKKNKKKNEREPHPNAERLRHAERRFINNDSRKQNSPYISIDGMNKGKQKYGSSK